MQQQSLLAVRCVKRLRVKWSRKLSTFVMPRLYFVAFLTGKRFFRFASSINDDEFLFERKKKKETKFHSTAYLDCFIWSIQTQHLFQPGKKEAEKNKEKKPSWVSTNFGSETKCKKNEIGAPATWRQVERLINSLLRLLQGALISFFLFF